MSFNNNVKNLNLFLIDNGFKLYPECSGKYKSWVKELDDEHLVYMYIYCIEHKEGSQTCYLIISLPRVDDDAWVVSPLAFGVQISKSWDGDKDFFNKCINRIDNIMSPAAYLKDAIINEINSMSCISTDSSDSNFLGIRQLTNLKAFKKLKEHKDFSELSAKSKDLWVNGKEILRLDVNLVKSCFEPYSDEIIMEYIDDYSWELSVILATYSVFK